MEDLTKTASSVEAEMREQVQRNGEQSGSFYPRQTEVMAVGAQKVPWRWLEDSQTNRPWCLMKEENAKGRVSDDPRFWLQ